MEQERVEHPLVEAFQVLALVVIQGEVVSMVELSLEDCLK